MEISYKGLTLRVPETVYVPAEDSFMLADAAEALEGDILEIGCGSGIVSLSCKKASMVLGLDINPDAVACAKENANRNGIANATFVQSDLFSNAKGKFDAILFNPPYLPTADDEHVSGRLDHAFDGGPDGRQVLDRFLLAFANHLKPNGFLLLVQSSLNDLEKTKSVLSDSGYDVEIADRKDFFFEKLFLLKAMKHR